MFSFKTFAHFVSNAIFKKMLKLPFVSFKKSNLYIQFSINKGSSVNIKRATELIDVVAFGTNPELENIKWISGDPVVRDEDNIVYLGIPLPFLDMGRQTYFDPIIQKLCAALGKTARARIPFEQASRVVYCKVAPSLAYASMVARPTKLQFSKLRGAIFALTGILPLILLRLCFFTQRIFLNQKPFVCTQLLMVGVELLRCLMLRGSYLSISRYLRQQNQTQNAQIADLLQQVSNLTAQLQRLTSAELVPVQDADMKDL